MAYPRLFDNALELAATVTASATFTPYAPNDNPDGYRRRGVLLAFVTGTVSGTSPTLTFQVQGSLDGVNWVNVASSFQFTATAQSNSVDFEAILPFYQVVMTAGGTSPSFGGTTAHLIFER